MKCYSQYALTPYSSSNHIGYWNYCRILQNWFISQYITILKTNIDRSFNNISSKTSVKILFKSSFQFCLAEPKEKILTKTKQKRGSSTSSSSPSDDEEEDNELTVDFNKPQKKGLGRLHISHLLEMVVQDVQTRLFFKAQSRWLDLKCHTDYFFLSCQEFADWIWDQREGQCQPVFLAAFSG